MQQKLLESRSMVEQDAFVTVLRSSDAQYVQTVIAVLKSEGIVCEHPGLNHAGLFEARIEIQLRVRESRREEALALIAELRADDASATPGRSTFRVKRTRASMFAAISFMPTFITSLVLGAKGIEEPVPIIIVVPAVAFMLGRWSRSDYCSRPDCGGKLAIDAERCAKCNSVVRGELKKLSEHFAALEAWERSQNTPSSD